MKLTRISDEEILAIIADNYGAEGEPNPIPVGYIAQAQLEADQKEYLKLEDHTSHLVDDVIRLEAKLKEAQEKVREIFEEIEISLEPDGHIKIYPSRWQALKQRYLED